jgi:RNA-directed DNA polymerase
VDIDEVVAYGEERFLAEIRQALVSKTYRVTRIRRVHIPKPGQPGRTRPLGIPTVKDRVVQMVVKLVIEPLFEADFLPCSYGFRPKRSPRMAVRAIREAYRAGYRHVVDVDLQSYFDTIDHQKLMHLVKRRVADTHVLRLIRAWLRAGIIEDGQVRHPVRGTPQGGVISPLLSNLFLHEIDRQWCMHPRVLIVRFADDMLFLTQTAQEAEEVWERLQQQCHELELIVNTEKSQLTTVAEGFRFLGFEFRERQGRLYFWPCQKAIKHLGERVRQTVRSIPNTERLRTLIKRLNRVLIGWCTYFRVGNSNRVFHRVDWSVRGEVCLWLRRKYRISWRKAKTRWNYRVLHSIYRLYRMVGKISYL